jgi:basic amino acid/polyamine antiporter, APA family
VATDVSRAAVPAQSGMFVRNSTGLVREVKPWQAMAINFITGAPPFVIGIALFGALSGFPGGNFLLAALLTIPLALAVVYAFGFMTAAMPRSGGDYVLVSRSLHPALGTVSSACISLSSFLSIAFEALAFCIFAVGPGLITIGLVGNHHRLVSWGSTVLASHNWQFGLGCGAIIVAGTAVGLGWTWAKRFMFSLLGFSIFGLVIVTLIALFAGKHSFIGHFNSFARPYTHNPDTYHATIAAAQKNGVNVHPAFSFVKTIPVVAVIAGISIYAYWSTFFAGEVRQGNSLKTANRMGGASIAILASVIVFVAIFFYGFGKDFLTASNAGGLPSSLGSSAAYFFLSSAYVNNTAFAIFIVLTFVLFWPVIIAETALQPPRTMFAWSFDGIMPKSVASVTKRGVPLVATVITIAGSIGAFAWAVYIAKNFFQVLAFATLAQLITHALVGLSAITFPYRRTALYRASVSTKEVAGIPLMVVAGVGAILVSAFLYWAFFHYPFFGLGQAKHNVAYWVGGAVAFGLLWYAGARYVRRQEGIDIDRVYAEIPPE